MNAYVYMYHYKAKSIDDDGSGGFLCCQTERTDKKKEEIKEPDRQKQKSNIKRRLYIVFNSY